MLKAGVVGLGKMGRRHLAVYHALHLDVVSFDSDPEALAATSSRGEITRESVEELLDAVDVVSVCTPVSEHVNLIEAAVEAGVHVLCEKPVALDLAACDRLIEVEASSSVVIAGGYLMRFAAELTLFEAAIEDPGRLGMPLFACITKSATGDYAAWKHSLRHGGGAAGEVLVHGLDLVRYLFGELSTGLGSSELLLRVRDIDGKPFEADAPDTVTELLRAGEVCAVLHANMLGKIAYTSISVVFEAGEIHARLGSGVIHERRNGVQSRTLVQNRRWLLAEVQEFLDSVEQGKRSSRLHGLVDTRALLTRWRE